MNEDAYLPLSYLSQYWYCPRRAGMLMLDQVWADNADTAAGTLSHRRVHDSGMERRGELVRLNNFSVRSERLGLSGFCDAIEATAAGSGACLPKLPGLYQLYPVEYKHGVLRDELEYEVQLCAQAMCLEEMFDLSIPEAALFYTDAHRRLPVVLNERLRGMVTSGAQALHEMLDAMRLPPPNASPKCHKCSMRDLCMPTVKRETGAYMKSVISAITDARQEERK